MQCKMSFILALLPASLLLASCATAALDTKLDENNVKLWIAEKYETKSCSDRPSAEEVWFNDPIQYHDFDGDGVDELVVTASTCWSGSGGHDVDLVLSRDGAGFKELKLPPTSRKYDYPNVRTINYRLSVEKGMLIATSVRYDESLKGNTLLVTYKWTNHGFAIKSVRVAPLPDKIKSMAPQPPYRDPQ